MILTSRQLMSRSAIITLTFSLVISMTATLTADDLKPQYSVRLDRNVRVPTRTGLTLSADLTRPDVDDTRKFPILIEYHPYRKDDVSWSGHDSHWYLAERGFICVRLDVRGTGGSQGVNTDEYHPQEQNDGYDAVEWLAKQPHFQCLRGDVWQFLWWLHGGSGCHESAPTSQSHCSDVRDR